MTVNVTQPRWPGRPRSRRGTGSRCCASAARSSPAALATGLDALRFAGLDPVTYPSAHDPGTMRRYLAGDDAMRAGDLRSALTDPGIAGILFARGGYGRAAHPGGDGLGRPGRGRRRRFWRATPTSPRVLEAVAVRLGWASRVRADGRHPGRARRITRSAPCSAR